MLDYLNAKLLVAGACVLIGGGVIKRLLSTEATQNVGGSRPPATQVDIQDPDLLDAALEGIECIPIISMKGARTASAPVPSFDQCGPIVYVCVPKPKPGLAIPCLVWLWVMGAAADVGCVSYVCSDD